MLDLLLKVGLRYKATFVHAINNVFELLKELKIPHILGLLTQLILNVRHHFTLNRSGCTTF